MAHRFRREAWLVLALAMLVGQLEWPNAARWWNQPKPGTIGVGRLHQGLVGIADDFLVYLPPEYRCNNCALVVFLHGSSDCGEDPTILKRCGPFKAVQAGARIPAIIVGPQCLPTVSWLPSSIARFTDVVASNYRVDRNRIYLIGYSMGGNGTWQSAACYPNLFAGLVPICGRGEPSEAPTLCNLAIWAFHGENDEVVPLAESQLMTDAIGEAGGQSRLTIIPQASHDICDIVCAKSELWKWLLSQHRTITSPRKQSTHTTSDHLSHSESTVQQSFGNTLAYPCDAMRLTYSRRNSPPISPPK